MAINQEPDIHELVICANMFVRKAGQWLMLKRSPLKKFAPGVLHPVGGKVDLNENALDSAKRELLEEAGITVKNVRLEAVILEILPPTGGGKNWMIFHFSGDYDVGEIADTEEGELVWVTREQLLAGPLFPSVAQVIDRILDPRDGTVFATMPYTPESGINVSGMSVDSCIV